MYQKQISPSPHGTPVRISGRSDLRLLTLQGRDGDVAIFYENLV
jgi:hypothetical protein